MGCVGDRAIVRLWTFFMTCQPHDREEVSSAFRSNANDRNQWVESHPVTHVVSD